jgi:hypothetical protein
MSDYVHIEPSLFTIKAWRGGGQGLGTIKVKIYSELNCVQARWLSHYLLAAAEAVDGRE